MFEHACLFTSLMTPRDPTSRGKGEDGYDGRAHEIGGHGEETLGRR